MAKVNAKKGDPVFFVASTVVNGRSIKSIQSIPIQKAGVQYLYIGIRKRINKDTMQLDTERMCSTQYYLTEEEAKKALARMGEMARLDKLAYRLKHEGPSDFGKTTEEIRELNEALEKFLGDEDPE